MDRFSIFYNISAGISDSSSIIVMAWAGLSTASVIFILEWCPKSLFMDRFTILFSSTQSSAGISDSSSIVVMAGAGLSSASVIFILEWSPKSLLMDRFTIFLFQHSLLQGWQFEYSSDGRGRAKYCQCYLYSGIMSKILIYGPIYNKNST